MVINASRPGRTVSGVEMPLDYALLLAGFLIGLSARLNDNGGDREQAERLHAFGEELRAAATAPRPRLRIETAALDAEAAEALRQRWDEARAGGPLLPGDEP